MPLSDLIHRNHYADIDQLAEGFAGFAATCLQEALTKTPTISLVVPGGNTPRYYLPALAACTLPWENITITLSDERWVEINDDASNELLVRKNLLSHLPQNARFIGLKTHHNNPFEAMNELHHRIDGLPLPIGLTVLGLGEDGHIASLFPGLNTTDLNTTQHCIAVDQPIAPSPRVSLSMHTLVQSQHIALVVVGKTKRQLLDQLSEHPDPRIPLIWLLQRHQTPISVFETDTVTR